MNKKQLKIIGPQEGEAVSVVGDTNRILIAGTSNNGALACIDVMISPGGGPAPHSHPNFQEFFYVIEGVVVVKAEGQEPYIAKKGSFVEIPKGGIVHQFKNETNVTAHLLLLVTPAGLEDLFREIGEPVKWGEFLPMHEPSAQDKEKLEQAAEKRGQQLFPSDYLKSK